MDKLKRFSEIDDMRGLAIFVMILIHTNAYFLSDKIAAIIWNWSQFAVPVFLFCSSYIYFNRQQATAKVMSSAKEWTAYLKKRFTRLLVPYYLFAIVFLTIEYWKEPAKIGSKYIIESLLLVGGIDINWLVLLFLALTIIMPVLAYLQTKQKKLFIIFCIMSLFSSFLFIFYHWSFDYKYIMWLPWSLMLIYAMYFVKYHYRKSFYALTIGISMVSFVTLLCIEMYMHHSLSFYDNKYPPNAFIMSYGIGSIAILHFLAKWGVFSITPIKQLLHFLSFNSYSLYFIHYTYLYLFSFVMWNYHWNWIEYFLAVITVSVLTQWLFQIAQKAWKRSHE